MPTGYTESMYDGKDISFKEFALECSRAMVAMAMLRDGPNSEIPEQFKVSDFYYERVETDREKIDYWMNISDKDLEAKAIDEKKETLTSAYDSCLAKDALRVRYEGMLEKVLAWVPPTEKHVNFKKFMTEQLESSIAADCRQYYDFEDIKSQIANPIVISNLDELRDEKITMAKEDLARSLEYFAKEEKNIASKNKWVKDLHDSLV